MPSSVDGQTAAVGGSLSLRLSAEIWMWTSGGSALLHIPKVFTGKMRNINTAHCVLPVHPNSVKTILNYFYIAFKLCLFTNLFIVKK